MIIRELLCLAVGAYQLVVFAYIILSWVPEPPVALDPVVRGVNALVSPLVVPLRRLLPSAGVGGVRFDLSIIVVLIGLVILRAIVCR